MTDLVSIYNNFKSILCLCPHCSQINRLNELSLSGKIRPPTTFLDTHYDELEKYAKHEEDVESEILERTNKLIKKKQLQHVKEFQKSLSPKIRNITKNPFDIIGIYNPIDGIAFTGMNNRISSSVFDVSKIILFNRRSKDEGVSKINDSMKKIIDDGKYDFKTIRWTDEELKVE